ncbi:MAG: Hsp20/alpha crystallin family protein [Planctomycetota bacterium JB042]
MTQTEFPVAAPTTSSAPVHAPATDMLEFDDRLELHLDLPGVAREDLEVKFEQGRLMVRAERTDAGETLTHREFGSARYRRAFALPDGYDAEEIEARLENGVLTLVVPKAAAHRPRRIEVR